MRKIQLVIITVLLLSNLILAAEENESFSRPIDADKFILIPGEQLIVTFINSKLEPLTLTVNSEGMIVDKTLGVLNLSGSNLTTAKKIISVALSKQYNVTDISISIEKPRTTSVAIFGAVTNPGIYYIKNSLRVSDLIKKAGGLLPAASSRKIFFSCWDHRYPGYQVDLDKSVYAGEIEADPYLYGGDEVYVPNKSNDLIRVTGEVNLPRDIEFIEGDEIGTIIKLAGGATGFADYKNSIIVRGNEKLSWQPLQAGDVIIVPSKGMLMDSTVAVFGAVNNQGLFNVDGQISIDNLLAQCGGLLPDANQKLMTIFRRPRVGLDGRVNLTRFPVTIPLNEENANLVVIPGDSVYVPAKVGFVKVSGEIANPGFYPYVENANIKHYISTAGGLLPTSDSEQFFLFNPLAGTTIKSSGGVIVPDGAELIIKKLEINQ